MTVEVDGVVYGPYMVRALRDKAARLEEALKELLSAEELAWAATDGPIFLTNAIKQARAALEAANG